MSKWTSRVVTDTVDEIMGERDAAEFLRKAAGN